MLSAPTREPAEGAHWSEDEHAGPSATTPARPGRHRAGRLPLVRAVSPIGTRVATTAACPVAFTLNGAECPITSPTTTTQAPSYLSASSQPLSRPPVRVPRLPGHRAPVPGDRRF